LTAGGWQMARAARIAAERLASGEGNQDFLRAKIATARFYADVLLPQTAGLAHAILHGGDSVLALPAEAF
jgi:hypothetical protein